MNTDHPAGSNQQQEFDMRSDLQAACKRKLDTDLPLVHKLRSPDVPSLKPTRMTSTSLDVFLEIAKRRVAARGGRIVFVMVPNMDAWTTTIRKPRRHWFRSRNRIARAKK